LSKNTQELLKILKNTNSIETYLEKESAHIASEPLPKQLEKLLEKHDLKKSQCIEVANLQRNYGYQIFSGERTPSRDKLLALCFAMHLTLDEIHALLCSTGYADLYAKNKRDSILIFGITKELSLIEINELLYELGEDVIE
jgi:hypothetical protein